MSDKKSESSGGPKFKLYWVYGLAILLGVLGFLAGLIGAFAYNGFVAGLIFLIVGGIGLLLHIVFTRVALEVIVVIFRIGENTSHLVTTQPTPASAHPPAPGTPSAVTP